jgi:hypothetical protein
MVARKRMLTMIRVVAVVLSMAGAALLGHSGIHAARAATTPESPPGSSIAAPAATDCDKDTSGDKDTDEDKSDDKDKDTDRDKADTDIAKPSSVDAATPAEKDSDDEDKSDDDDCGAKAGAGGVAVPVPVVPVPAPAPPAAAPPAAAPPAAAAPTTGGVKAAAGKAPPATAVPKTGAEVPIGAGLILTGAGLGALAAGRRLRRRA